MDPATDIAGRYSSVPMKDKNGREVLVCIVKYTFRVDPTGRVDLEPEESAPAPYVADECNGDDPAKASIRKPSDLCDFKPGTDVLLIGHAQPPRGSSVTHVDVSLRVGPISKTVRAHGLRVWEPGTFTGIQPGPALPIREPVPLIYELAWGGQDLSDPAKPIGEPRNYVGRGVARDAKSLVGRPAAQLEDPARPISGRNNVPWSFGAIHRHWQPRASFSGTYDQLWEETRLPLLPSDFDDRFNVTVPHDQWSPTPLRGDEPIEVAGATPEGIWRIQLPRVTLGFASYVAGRRSEHRSHLDTVLVDADARRVELTWRASVPLPRKWEMLDRVIIFEKTLVRSRTAQGAT